MTDDIPLILEREAGLADHFPQVAVGFGFMPMQDHKKSQTAGHPVFKDVEFCKIVVPGDKQSVYCQPAKDEDRHRFPKAYAAFKNRESTPLEGLPIEQWPQVTRAMSMTLKAMHVHTVEALAEVNDANLGNLGQFGRDLRAKAQAYVKQAGDSAALNKMAEEKRALEEQLKTMQQQLNDLASRVPAAPVAAAPKKRGPKSKAEQAEAA